MTVLWVYPLRRGETLAAQDWVEWHIHRFLTSRFLAHMVAAGHRDVIATAMILWSESYRLDPAGTLPDDDVQLAQLAHYGTDVDAWRAVRPLALYGWSPVVIEGDDLIECDDVRLGHRVVAEIAARSHARKAAKAASRSAQQAAVAKSRVRKKLAAMGRKVLAANDGLVDHLTRWLVQNGLHITDDNIAAGLDAIGASANVVPMPRGRD